MAETETIATMATLISDKIFAVFGWSRKPLMNQNFECVDKENHKKQRKPGTHPTDCVFNYTDPYSGKNIFINTDLKSYAKTTLETTDLPKAIRNLGRSTECANRSADWASLFVGEVTNFEVIGLLFIFNHDGDYDSSFSKKLEELSPSSLHLQKETAVYVLGPERIIYLHSVAMDIKELRHDGFLPSKDSCSFFYPHLNRQMAVHTHHVSATLPTLLCPLIVLWYEHPTKQSDTQSQRGVYAYYDGPGDSINEFKYLLSYFFKYQLASENTDIFISCANASPTASAHFTNAKNEFAKEYWSPHVSSIEEYQGQLNRIRFRSVTVTSRRFSETEIGMRLS